MLQLRTREGCDFRDLRARFGESLGSAAAAACVDAASELSSDWARLEPGRALALLEPDGFLFSNDAISTVLARLDERLPPAEVEAHTE